MGEAVVNVLNTIDDIMYYPILIIVMAVAGLYFTILTRGVQIRLFKESCWPVCCSEKPRSMRSRITKSRKRKAKIRSFMESQSVSGKRSWIIGMTSALLI